MDGANLFPLLCGGALHAPQLCCAGAPPQFDYNKTSDTLYVGIDFYGIGGDADGDEDPSHTSSALAGKGGVDWPNLGNEESICMTFDTDFYSNVHEVVVGISGFDQREEFGTYRFIGNKNAPALGFGPKIEPNNTSVLYCIPNATCPDFEFYIKDYSKLPDCNFAPGESFKFRTIAFAGSLADDGIGEDFLPADVFYNLTDFGDAPESYGTLLKDDGPRHLIVPELHLGALIDDEADGQPDDNATGDDLSGKNDEDGVTFGPLYTGDTAKVTVNASINFTKLGAPNVWLNAWVDFDGNGNWSGPNEHVIDDADLANGSNSLTFQVPDEAKPGPTFARFRLSTVGNLSATGNASDDSTPDGEVEDYGNLTIDRPEIEVNKTALPKSGAPCTDIDFTIKVTNNGTVRLDNVTAVDTLPFGLKYISNDRGGSESYGVVSWPNLGSLEPNNSTFIHLIVHINGSIFGKRINQVNVSGTPPGGQSVDNSTITDVTALKPNIEVQKIADLNLGAPSTKINFTIRVTNTGNVTLKTVSATDTLPFGLNYISDDRNGNESDGIVAWQDLGSLEPDESTFIHLIAHINGSRFGKRTNLVNVTGQPPTGDNVTNSTQTNVTALKPNIEVNKTADPKSGAPSTKINFTIRVINTGNITLKTVEVIDTLPAGLNYVWDNRTGNVSNKTVAWPNLGPLEPNESSFILLKAHIDGSRLGILTNQVNATGLPPAGNKTDNSTEVNVTAYKPNIEVNKTAIPDSGAPSTNINFTIKVTNAGNITLKTVEVMDTLPEGLNYVWDNCTGIVSNRTVTWPNLGPLDPNQSTFILLIAHIDGEKFGILTNRVNVTGLPPTGNKTDNSTEVNVTAYKPNIEVNKTAIPDSGAPLANISFTIKITNTGNITLKSVEAEDTLPSGLDYIWNNRSGTESNGVVTWPSLGSLEPNESTVIQFFAHINGSQLGVLTNEVNVTGQPPTGNSVTNSTKANVTALPPNIVVEKIAIPDSGAPSTILNFTIKVTNAGKVDLDVVEAKDTLPFGLDYVSDNISCNISNASCNLGSLKPGESKFVQLRAHINGKKFGKLTIVKRISFYNFYYLI